MSVYECVMCKCGMYDMCDYVCVMCVAFMCVMSVFDVCVVL